MSSATAVKFEFRCSRCYQTLFASTDEAGSPTVCQYCGHGMTIPQPTADGIKMAQGAPEQVLSGAQPAGHDVTMDSWSDGDIERELKRQMQVAPGDMITLSQMASSRLKRFLGMMIDGFVLVFAYIGGFLLVMALSMIGLVDVTAFKGENETAMTLAAINAIGVMYFPAVAVLIFQWWLIATRGQSIGKFLLAMRIVTDGGRNPGFFQGVILRNWVRNLLNLIPFFALIDALFIFGESKRCMHDFIASTHVVDV